MSKHSKKLASALYDNENMGAPTLEADPDYPVVITLARDYGADAHEIGIALQERLGIPLYDCSSAPRSVRIRWWTRSPSTTSAFPPR